MQFTQEQVISLAPDPASVKAGQKLASTAKWVERYQHEKALWGACKGSGKNPYKTIIDLENLAFKCSCPSRKFPCKHSLGLLFLVVSQPEAFNQRTELAEHVAEWLNKRMGRVEKKATKVAKPVDVKAQQKRAAARIKKVEGGLLELRLWLKDVIRTGILTVPNDVYQFSQNITARMVDAQAGGLARQLRSIENINFYGENWQKPLTKKLAGLYVLTEAYQGLDRLPVALQAEVKTLIGWTTAKEEVLAQKAMQDDWLILSKTIEEEERLQVERVWVYGKTSQQIGLILNFYGFNQVPQHSFVGGSSIQAELVAYPGTLPLRMMVKSQAALETTFESIPAPDCLTELYKRVAEVMAINPFAEQIPILLSNMQLSTEEDTWYLVDTQQQAIALQNPVADCWASLAVSEGKPFSCFGNYENEQFILHAIWQGNNYYPIR